MVPGGEIENGTYHPSFFRGPTTAGQVAIR